ncbi:MAG: 2-C-methyl-D-erythritol 4-phosphate cytidylyltransferase [Opitutia bacterium UBA7350]|nr:MAG: 2-C-methyl-D-erythritol 4-phosphate cytidylyltransferase [Opitutae bacterium UBA7350]
MNALILLAGGSGTRMNATDMDKTLIPLDGRAVIKHSAQTFLESGFIDHLIIVFRDIEQRKALEAALKPFGFDQQFIQGGSTRQDSVLNALKALPEQMTHVYIHDSARPLVSRNALKLLEAALAKDGAAVLAKPVSDTVKLIASPAKIEKILPEDLDRTRLWAMETPQAFAMPAILDAYQYAQAEGLHFTDDAAVASHYGLRITLVYNPDPNPKITTSDDLEWMAYLTTKRP